MATRKRATRHDLPTLLLGLGIILALFTAASPIASKHDFNAHLASESELQTIKGTVTDVSWTIGRESNLYLTVEDGGQTYHLIPIVWSTRFRQWQSGDQIVARVKPDYTHRLNWCWELQRNGSMMVSYEDSLNYKLEERRRGDEVIPWAAGFALAFFSCAVLLQRYFGAWSEKGFVRLEATLLPKS